MAKPTIQALPVNKSKGTPVQPQAVNIFEAQNAWATNVESLLQHIKDNQNNPKAMETSKANLRTLCHQAYTETQKMLLKGHAGGATLLRSDPIGWTTNTTVWSTESVIEKNPYGSLVSQYLQECIDKEKEEAKKNNDVVTPAAILQAQLDSKDPEKKEVLLEGAEMANGEKTDLIIDKETGDMTVKQTDSKGKVQVGFVKGLWKNIKDFCSNIWKYLSQTWSRFTEWVKSFFTVPEEQDVIFACATK